MCNPAAPIIIASMVSAAASAQAAAEANKNRRLTAAAAKKAALHNMASVQAKQQEERAIGADKMDKTGRIGAQRASTAKVAGASAGVVPTDILNAMAAETSQNLFAQRTSIQNMDEQASRTVQDISLGLEGRLAGLRETNMAWTIASGLAGIGAAYGQGLMANAQYDSLNNPKVS
jgi:hypothetical protein